MNKLVILLISLFLAVSASAVPTGTGPAGVGSGGGGGGAATLDGIGDVDTTGVAATDVLCYNGTTWVDCPVGVPGAHATSHEPGGADVVDEILYTPSNNAEYGGSDPGNVDEALHYLAANRLDFRNDTTDDPNGAITCTTPPCIYVDTNGRSITGSNPQATTGVPLVWQSMTASNSAWTLQMIPVERVSQYAKAYPSSTTGGIQEAVMYGCPNNVSGGSRFACVVLVDVPAITLTDPVRAGSCSSSSLQNGVLIAGLQEAYASSVPPQVAGNPTITWNGTETGQLATMFQFQCTFNSGLANLTLLMDASHDGTNYARVGIRQLAHKTTGLSYETNWSSGHTKMKDIFIWGSNFQHLGDGVSGGSNGAGGPAGANCPTTKDTCMIGSLKDSTAPYDNGTAVAEQTGQTFSVTDNGDGTATYQITAGGGSFGSYAAGDFVSFNTAFAQGRNEGTFQILAISTTSTANDTVLLWHPYAVTEAGAAGVAFAEPNEVDSDFAHSTFDDIWIMRTDVGYWFDTSQGVNDLIIDGELNSIRDYSIHYERGQADLVHVGIVGPVDYPSTELIRRSTNAGTMFRWYGASVEVYEAGSTYLHLTGSGSNLESVIVDSVRFQPGALTNNLLVVDAGHQAEVVFDHVRLEGNTATYNLNLNGGSGSFFTMRQSTKDTSVTVSPTIAGGTITDCENVDTTSGRFFDSDCDFVKDAGESYLANFADITKVNAVTGTFNFSSGILRLPNSGALPGTCSVGDVYAHFGASTGRRLYLCETTNTWVLQGDGGGGGGGNIQVEGVSTTNVDFRGSGDILFTLCTGVGTPDASCLQADDVIGRVQANSVTLGTDTSGNYAAGDAEGGAALTGDSATGFFSTGIIEDARLDGTAERDEVVVGANTQIQFNDSGTMGADAQLAYDKNTNTLTIGDGSNQGVLDVKCPTPGSMDCSQTYIEDTTTATPSAGNRKLQARSDGFYERDSSAAEGRFLTTRASSVTSSEVAVSVTNETGTGLVVMNNTPSLTNAQIADYMEGTEAAAPGTPAAGKVRFYAKSGTPGQFCSKDDAGTEICMDTGSGGSGTTVAIDGASVGANINFDDGGHLNFTNDGDGTASVTIKTMTKSRDWMAGAIITDGSSCATPTEQTINSGPKAYFFSCADSASSIFQGSTIMPDGWNGTAITFELFVWHGTTEAITFAGDFSAQCRGSAEIPSSTWGTAQAADVAITTANQVVSATSAAVTPDGTCAGGDVLYWRYVIDDLNFSTNAANSKIVGVKAEYVTNASDE